MPWDHYIIDADMKKVADAIRTKGGTADLMKFPDGMVSAIEAIPSGGGSCDEDAAKVLDKTLTSIENSASTLLARDVLAYCTELTSVSFPEVTEIGGSTFTQDTALTDVSLPKCTKIGSNCFSGCIALKNLSLPLLDSTETSAFSGSGLKTFYAPVYREMLRYTFNRCASLESFSAPGLTAMGDSNFENCTSLKNVFLPSIQNIGKNEFKNCTALENLFIGTRDSTAPIVTVGVNLLFGNDTAQIYVPNAQVDDYKAASGWNAYADRIHPFSDIQTRTWTDSDFDIVFHPTIGADYFIKPNIRQFFSIGDSFSGAFAGQMWNWWTSAPGFDEPSSSVVPGLSRGRHQVLIGTITGGTGLPRVMTFNSSDDPPNKVRTASGSYIPIV